MRKRNIYRVSLTAILAIILGAILVFNSAKAQTTDGATAPEDMEQPRVEIAPIEIVPIEIVPIEIVPIEIVTRPRENTPLQAGVPMALDMSFVNIPGAKGDLAAGVTVKAFARYVEVEGKKVGQLILAGVEKGDRQEPLTSENFVAQFDLEKPELNPQENLIVKGNQAELIAALERLQEEGEPEEVEEQVVANDNDGPQEAGNNGPQNEQAAAYQRPDPVEVAKAPETTTQVTTDGCDIKVDIAQGVAIVQSKLITYEDGVMTSESACSDDSTRYSLEKSYSVCSDEVDLTAMTATAQFIYYYVDSGTNRVEVDACRTDPEKVFEIVEKLDNCPMTHDYDAGLATPQAALVYINDNNVQTQVRGCDVSTEQAAVPMLETTSGCSIRHDFAAGKSYGQTVWTYQINGLTYQAGTCTDNGREFTHVTAYKDSSNNNLCHTITDMSTMQAHLQNRKYITVDGLKEFITECTPDTSATSIVATTNGCTDVSLWTHDYTASQSYGQERHYYMDSGSQVFINSCQNSEATYAHQTETDGWKNYDDRLFAFATETIYILPPSGRYDLKQDYVPAGSTQIPYSYNSTSEIPTGVTEYTDGSCDALREYGEYKLWDRPDSTTYNEYIGAGSPVSVFACTVTAAPYWEFIAITGREMVTSSQTRTCTTTYTGGGGGTNTYQGRGAVYRTHASYTGKRPVSREDGQTFTQTSENTNVINFDNTVWCGERGDYPTPPETLYNQAVWDAAEGW